MPTMPSWTIHDGPDLYAMVYLAEGEVAVTQISEQAIQDGFLDDLKKALLCYHPMHGFRVIRLPAESFEVDLWMDQYIQEHRIIGDTAMMYSSDGVDVPAGLNPEGADPDIVY